MKNNSGFSLIESLLVVVVVGILVFLLASIPNSLMLMTKSKHASLAREIAVKQMEDKRATDYINLINENSNIADNRLSLLPQGVGIIVVEDCDPVANSQFCPNNEHIKFVTVTVSWKDNDKVQDIILKTMIGEGGVNQ